VPRKTDKLSIRIDPVFKEALQKVAEMEHRSAANMIEVFIRDYCRKIGVKIEGVPAATEQATSRKTRREARSDAKT
jgi:hypothetical protein